MINALQAGVTGLQAHQTMLDVAGNNLANVSTTAFKSSRVTFSSMLAQTIREASGATEGIGGRNPMQVGSGVLVGSVDRNVEQGGLDNTGNPLDMAIDGSGFFVLNDGQQDVYTRVGQFEVDSEYYLVDPRTGYRVQRIGSEGVSDGFQDATNSSIRIPWDTALPAHETTSVTYTGNLTADTQEASTNVLSSGLEYTKDGAAVTETATLDELDQATSLDQADVIRISGTRRDGSTLQTDLGGGSTVDYVEIDMYDSGEGRFKTVGEVLDEITAAYANPDDAGDEWSRASIVSSEIRLTDTEAGYSRTDMSLTYVGAGDGDLELPDYFNVYTPGGEAVKTDTIEVFDSQGNSYKMTSAFVKRDDAENKWDLVLMSVSGEGVQLEDRRIEGLSFLTNGSYGGLDTTIGDESSFSLYFPNAPTDRKVIRFDFGTSGEFDGITQFAGASTAAGDQDGYSGGWLDSISTNADGVLVGVFTNGLQRDIATLKLATFQNPSGLKDIGNGYFTPSANSGDAVPKRAAEGGAGTVHGGQIEKSNVEVAAEFVNLIQAQNGFQANARTIRSANDMLQELTDLVR